MPELLLEGVRHSFIAAGRLSKHLVLDDVSLRVDEGECVVIRGANGAGKSTLLRIAAGLLRPEAGQASYAGRPLSRWRDRSGEIGFLPQSNALYLDLTVAENFALAAALSKHRPKHTSESELTERLGIDAFVSKRVRDCSQGSQRRIAFARMLLLQPSLLLLDEPCAHIDEAGKAAIIALLAELRAKGGSCVIVEHQLDALAPLSPRGCELSHARLRELQ